MKRDPMIVIGVVVAAFLGVMLAVFEPEAAIFPTIIAAAVLWFATSRRSDRRAAKREYPCQQCGRRYRIGDLAEHHVREHRECAS